MSNQNLGIRPYYSDNQSGIRQLGSHRVNAKAVYSKEPDSSAMAVDVPCMNCQDLIPIDKIGTELQLMQVFWILSTNRSTLGGLLSR